MEINSLTSDSILLNYEFEFLTKTVFTKTPKNRSENKLEPFLCGIFVVQFSFLHFYVGKITSKYCPTIASYTEGQK